MEVPGTPKGVVLQIQKEHGFNVNQIAHAIAVTPKTIYNILNDETPNGATNFALLRLYVRLKMEIEKKQLNYEVREERAIYTVY